jgi:hypothetical protein
VKVRSIDLDDDGMPESVTVVMTAREAAVIMTMIGKTSINDRMALFDGADQAAKDIHSALLGDVADRFYEDGICDMARELNGL